MIYICSHKPDKIPYKLDCTYKIVDNNCSNLSENYRHLRGMKLILENENPLPDEIGIFQNRRFMEYGYIPEGYDIVVADDFSPFQLKLQYASCHNIKDIEIAEKIIGPDFTKYINIPYNREAYFHNMFIMKKTDYQKYCEFLFSVLAEHDILADSDVDDAFLAERIGSYWIWKNIPKDKIYVANTITVNIK